MNLIARYVFVLGFFFGVGIFSYYDFGFIELLLVLLFLTSFVGVYTVRKRALLFFALVLFLGLVLGGGRMLLETSFEGESILVREVGTEVELEGIIVVEPDKRERSTRLTIETEDAKLILSAPTHQEYQYGDKVLVKGILRKPENFTGDTGREFDYVNFLNKDDIEFTISFPEVEVLSSGYGNAVKEKLFALKQAWLREVELLIPDPQSSLLGGLVVGAKQSLGEELNRDFRRTGIIHIVVLSGYNVTIVAEAIMRSLTFLSPFLRASFGGLSIVLFAIMTGGSATIVRASIMALLVLLARATGRTSHMTHALFFTGMLMVFHNPHILLHDPSFQLSFMATLGLLQLSPHFEKVFSFITESYGLRQILAATLATQIFVLPLLIYMMGEVSLVAPIVNMLILIFIPTTMLFGFLAGVFGFIGLGAPFGYVSYLLLSYELAVVDFFSNMPFAAITLPPIPFWTVALTYVVLFGVLYLLKQKDVSQPLPN